VLCASLNSQLAVGGLCGNVDIFDAYLHKELYQGKFEFTYVTKSRVRLVTQIMIIYLQLVQILINKKKLIHHHDR
jgi:hypothetical protein